MKKTLLILLFPIIVNSQQIDCSLLKVTEVVIDNTNMTFDIAIYNGDTIGMSYPFVAYTINNIGDTIQQGSLNLFGAPGLDTTLYNYSITNAIFSIYPLPCKYFIASIHSFLLTLFIIVKPLYLLNILYDIVVDNQKLHVYY